jgi:hypothetical protein
MSGAILLPMLAATVSVADPPVTLPTPVAAVARVLRLLVIPEQSPDARPPSAAPSDAAPRSAAPSDVRIRRSIRACGTSESAVPQTCTVIFYEVE